MVHLPENDYHFLGGGSDPKVIKITFFNPSLPKSDVTDMLRMMQAAGNMSDNQLIHADDDEKVNKDDEKLEKSDKGGYYQEESFGVQGFN